LIEQREDLHVAAFDGVIERRVLGKPAGLEDGLDPSLELFVADWLAVAGDGSVELALERLEGELLAVAVRDGVLVGPDGVADARPVAGVVVPGGRPDRIDDVALDLGGVDELSGVDPDCLGCLRFDLGLELEVRPDVVLEPVPGALDPCDEVVEVGEPCVRPFRDDPLDERAADARDLQQFLLGRCVDVDDRFDRCRRGGR
jgi:hypothetical protein